MPIAVRYTQDAFSRSGWLWPVDAKGEPLKATSYMAVGFYVAKYVNKKSDMEVKMSTVESIARPRRNGERRRAPTPAISKESPAITGVVEMVIRRPIRPARKPTWERSCGIRSAPV